MGQLSQEVARWTLDKSVALVLFARCPSTVREARRDGGA